MKKYQRLRKAMRDHEISGEQLGMALGGITRNAVSKKLTGKVPWTLKEMYIIMDLLDIPYEQMYLYFSKDGQWVEPEKIIKNAEFAEAIKEVVAAAVTGVVQRMTA